jgi:hypothetical protein
MPPTVAEIVRVDDLCANAGKHLIESHFAFVEVVRPTLYKMDRTITPPAQLEVEIYQIKVTLLRTAPPTFAQSMSFCTVGAPLTPIGIVDFRLLKTCIQIFRSRLERLPQYKPTMNRVSRDLVHDETIVPFYITDV